VRLEIFSRRFRQLLQVKVVAEKNGQNFENFRQWTQMRRTRCRHPETRGLFQDF
jgi:hypothetical protein